MTRVDKLLDAAKRMQHGTAPNLLFLLPDGTEKPMDFSEALRAGGMQFIRTLDGNHDFDELFIAVFNSGEIDVSDLEELAGQ